MPMAHLDQVPASIKNEAQQTGSETDCWVWKKEHRVEWANAMHIRFHESIGSYV